ncbi:DUF4412 domain-containing protein [Odoribacter sp. OttesenSCG-928-L07]|nr:DUF4412 domain-containing protein [Odoribacter sp. OttesenSCG-928-L07]
MKKLFLTFAILSLISISTLNAQKVFTGTIEYEITYPGTEVNPMIAAYLPSSAVLTFGTNKCKTVQASSVMSTVIIVDGDENLFYILFNGMGQKLMAKESIDTDELNNAKPEMKVYDGETKTIAGYECVKTEVIVDDGSGKTNSYFGYFSSDIYNPTYALAGDLGTEGIPLEIDIEMGEMKMKMIAKKVKQSKIKDSEFSIPEGYTEVSMDALQNMGM